MTKIARVGVIGAGQMGSGIAHVFALAGYDVLLHDIDHAGLKHALAVIANNLARQVDAGKVGDADRAAALSRIGTATELSELGATDLVVEAATEHEATKVRIFQALVPHLAPHTILTTNTSALSITRLAAATDRPERFMGLHFMNPVPVVELVELICGIATSDQTCETLLAVTKKLGKTAVNSADVPGFLVNRMLIPMINEAVFALQDGVGTVDNIDASLRLGARHPMGPLELADLIGLDTCLAIMVVLHDGMGDPKYRPAPLLRRYVEAGWLGRKSGRGFYDYRGKPRIPTQ